MADPGFLGGWVPGHSNQMPQPSVDRNIQMLKINLSDIGSGSATVYATLRSTFIYKPQVDYSNLFIQSIPIEGGGGAGLPHRDYPGVVPPLSPYRRRTLAWVVSLLTPDIFNPLGNCSSHQPTIIKH